MRQEASEGEGKVDVGKGKAEEEGEEEDAEDAEEADAAGGDSCNSKCEKVLKFMPLDGVSKSLPYYATLGTPDIQKWSSRAKKALLIFHSVGMNPDGYLCYVYNALKASSAKEKDWYIASVGLFTDTKVKGDSRLREKGAMSWRSSSYWAYGKRGESSLSSFEAVDQLLAHFRNKKKFKRLTDVVVAGHGGGAQFVQRFALMGGSTSGIKVRYVVANPSTFFYATKERPVLPKKSSLTCDSFDAKKYTAGSW